MLAVAFVFELQGYVDDGERQVGVRMQRTAAPLSRKRRIKSRLLYAAMPPEMMSRMRFPTSTVEPPKIYATNL